MPLLTSGFQNKRVHLLGICGTAMASLAGMLKEKGFQVSGSDSGIYPPMSTFLADLDIPVLPGYRKENLTPRPDLVVVGNSIARGNEELEYILDEGIPYTSMPEILRILFLANRIPMVMTGTHGKTTTAAMLAWALQTLGTRPSFLIGGIPVNFKTSYQLRDSKYFVLEGDEYDSAFFDKAPKFFHYRPHILVINPIEFDHADIYPNLEAILLQFRRLVNIVPSAGFIAFSHENEATTEVVRNARCKTESIGLHHQATWRAVDIRTENERTLYSVLYQGRLIGKITLNVHGEHNVMNSLAVCSILHHLAYPWDGIRTAMERFLGVERRMTLRGEYRDIRIFDDFAHHPSAIRQTLHGTRMRFPESRIWAIFEPRSWTCRLNTHQEAMAGCFDDADTIILADVYNKDVIPPEKRFRPELTTARLNAQGRDAHHIATADEIVAYMGNRLKPGDVVVVMSNGGFDDIHHKLIDTLKRKWESKPEPDSSADH